MCDVDSEAVAAARGRAEHLRHPARCCTREGLDAYVVRRLDLPFRDVDWTRWDKLLRRVHSPAHQVEIALVGKYIDLPDAYLSVTEAMRAGGFDHDAKVTIRWVASDECQTEAGRAEGARRASTRCWCPAASACAGSRASSARCAGPARAGPDARASAWACSAWSSSTPATSPASRTRARRSSTPTPAPGHRDDGGAEGDRRRRGRPRRHDAARAPTRPSCARARSSPRPTARERRRAAPAPLRGQQRLPRGSSRRPGWSSPAARRTAARRVRRAAPRGAPLLRLDAGPPGVQVAPDRAAPAVRRPRRGGARRAQRARAVWSRSSARAAGGRHARDRPTAAARPAERAGRPLRPRPCVHTEVAMQGMRLGRRARPGRPRRGRRGTSASTSGTPARWPWSRSTTRAGICLIQQYRHPVRAYEWEIPAGLLDVAGEPPHVGAARELHEEADLVAGTWHVLADYFSSPGGLDEALRVYLARDLAAVPATTARARRRGARDARALGPARGGA